MYTAEKHNFFHYDLYGSWQDRTAKNPVFVTMLSQKTFHFQRVNASGTDCNAAACYDRMIPGITSIAETNTGTPEEVLVLLVRTLQNMKHHISSEKGISKAYNRHSEANPIYGTGQGATD
eukprot:2868572-Ditylum_brightwellii.AAC.1